MKSESEVAPTDALTGCTAVVAGATTPLGFLAARVLGQSGARLMLCARHPERLEHAMQDLQAWGIDTRWVAADCHEPLGIDRLVQATLERMGDIDVLVTALREATMAARVAEQVARVSMLPRRRGRILHLERTPAGLHYDSRPWTSLVLDPASDWASAGVSVNAVHACHPLDPASEAEGFEAAVRLFTGPCGRAFTGQSLALGRHPPFRQGTRDAV